MFWGSADSTAVGGKGLSDISAVRSISSLMVEELDGVTSEGMVLESDGDTSEGMVVESDGDASEGMVVELDGDASEGSILGCMRMSS